MNSLKGQLLVAASGLLDPNFFRTVVLMVQHNEQGALGLILNRPTATTIQEAWEQIDDGSGCTLQGVIHQGGPCEGPLMLIHNDPDSGEIEVVPGVYFTTDRDTVQRLVERAADPLKFFVGYAGWSPGQLEHEMEEGGWVVAPATPQAVFDNSADDQWARVVKEISFNTLFAGLDPKLIPPDPSMN